MARLGTIGFELNSTAANVELTGIGTAGFSISTSNPRTGTYHGRISSMTTITTAGFAYCYVGTAGSGPYFARFYVNFTTFPSAANVFASFRNATNFGGAGVFRLDIDNNGIMHLKNSNTLVATAANALNTGQWYCIELKFDSSGGAGASIMEVKQDGVVILTASNLTFGTTTAQTLLLGGNLLSEANTTGQWDFDDVAVNDNTGNFQTGYPGPGNVVLLKPSAAGDNNAWATQTGGTAGSANNYTRVNEIPPDDATSFNASKVLNQTDDFNLDDTPAGLNASAIISAVQVFARFEGGSSSANSSFVSRIKAAAAGTVEESSAITPTVSTSYASNQLAAPRNPNLTLYDLPGTTNGTSWFKSDLDSAQVGVRISTGNTNVARITALYVLLDYLALNGTIQFDAKSSSRTSAATGVSPLTFTHTTGAALSNSKMIVLVSIEDSNHPNCVISALTYGGVALTNVRGDQAAGDNRTEIWYLDNPAAGAGTISVTPTGAVGELAVTVITISGAASGAPEANNGATGNSTGPTSSVTTVADKAWVFGIASCQDVLLRNGNIVQCSDLRDQSFENAAAGYIPEVSPAASTAFTYTAGSGQSWAVSAISVAPFVASSVLNLQKILQIPQAISRSNMY